MMQGPSGDSATQLPACVRESPQNVATTALLNSVVTNCQSRRYARRGKLGIFAGFGLPFPVPAKNCLSRRQGRHRFGQVLVGRIVAGELLLLRIPFQGLPQPDGSGTCRGSCGRVLTVEDCRCTVRYDRIAGSRTQTVESRSGRRTRWREAARLMPHVIRSARDV